jgi:hypothetical protein
MGVAAMTPEQCPFRREARAGGKAAVCLLVGDLAGVRDEELLAVRREVCAACCREPRPTPADLNPVVASLLYGLAEKVIARGGVPGCDAAKAAALRSRADQDLLWIVPGGTIDYESRLRHSGTRMAGGGGCTPAATPRTG